MMNADFSKDSSKQVALLELEGDGNNVAGYDLTKVDGGVSAVRTLEQAQNPIIYEFTKVGDGFCRDSNNNIHDYISFFSIVDVDACKAKCEECPGQSQAAGRELRGIAHLSNGCFCHLEEGGFFDASDCTGATASHIAETGTGAICNLGPPISAECWKVVDSNLQCPTLAPSTSPTETLTPTVQPTLAPTNANTKAGKVAKVSKVNGIVDLQVQEMKSSGSSVSISPHVVRGEMRGRVERLEGFPLPTFYISQHKVEFELVNVGRARWQHGVRMNINFVGLWGDHIWQHGQS
eukprot:scaffold3034_cov110-Skeletonema_dohrnii-CCMP3373.AAC.11